ncbi:MAG: hypothetical protein AAF728_13670, partial [Cyanobacteria bacterium P01_D01_bin.128]
GSMASEALEQGLLQQVLHDYCPPEVPITALYLERRLVAPRVQAFIDFMAEQKCFSFASVAANSNYK